MVKGTQGKVKRIIRQRFLNARETIIRQGEVDMIVHSNLLGLTPGGDLKEFIRETRKAVKGIKRV